MVAILSFVLAVLVAVVVVQLVANKSGLPSATLLTLVGLAYSFVPGPNISLQPELVMTFVIPPCSTARPSTLRPSPCARTSGRSSACRSFWFS